MDYELTARQGADTLAYIALLEEKLRPALVGVCVGVCMHACLRMCVHVCMSLVVYVS